MFPPGDVAALAGALAGAAGDPSRLRDMGRRASARVHARHGIETAADAVVRAALAVAAPHARVVRSAG